MEFVKVLPKLPERRDDAATAQSKQEVLAAIEELGVIKEALEKCKVSMATATRWRREDRGFAEDWDYTVRNHCTMLLEAEGLRRALAGSDALLIFFLKAADRARYDDNVARNNQEKRPIKIEMVDANSGAVIAGNSTDGGSSGSA